MCGSLCCPPGLQSQLAPTNLQQEHLPHAEVPGRMIHTGNAVLLPPTLAAPAASPGTSSSCDAARCPHPQGWAHSPHRPSHRWAGPWGQSSTVHPWQAFTCRGSGESKSDAQLGRVSCAREAHVPQRERTASPRHGSPPAVEASTVFTEGETEAQLSHKPTAGLGNLSPDATLPTHGEAHRVTSSTRGAGTWAT